MGSSGRGRLACVAPGSCLDNFEQVRTECPRERDYLGEPLEIAENLCPIALANQFEARKRATAAALIRTAWHAVEAGLAYGTAVPDRASQLFLAARGLIAPIIDTPESSSDYPDLKNTNPIQKLGAHALGAYLPAFEARTQPDNTFSGLDCRSLYSALVNGIATLKPKERRRTNGHLAESEIMALSARIGRPNRLIYPASPREEQQHDERKVWNHDAYILARVRTGLVKCPIQIKYSGFDPGEDPPMGQDAYLAYRRDILNPAGVPEDETLAEYLIADLKHDLSSAERRLLNKATSLTLAYIERRLRAA